MRNVNGMRDNRVAEYRQTPEFAAWRKTYGKHHAVEQVLGKQLQRKMSELQVLQEALQQVTVGKQRLLQLMPQEQVFELEGQRAQAQAPPDNRFGGDMGGQMGAMG